MCLCALAFMCPLQLPKLKRNVFLLSTAVFNSLFCVKYSLYWHTPSHNVMHLMLRVVCCLCVVMWECLQHLVFTATVPLNICIYNKLRYTFLLCTGVRGWVGASE